MTTLTRPKHCTLILLAVLTAALSGCSALESSMSSAVFSRFHGDPESFRGEGGKNTQIDGLDVWQDSFPNRRYRILGTITARGFSEEARLVEAVSTAKSYHADALIVMNRYGPTSNSGADVGFSAMGGSGMGFGAGTSLVVPLERPQSMYLAVQYTRH